MQDQITFQALKKQTTPRNHKREHKIQQQSNLNFRISHNSIPNHFSYFNPYLHQSKPQQKTAYKSPGPGNYEISLPLVKPKYLTIFKKNEAIIIKINDNHGSSSFRNRQQRFKNSDAINPGPGSYSPSKELRQQLKLLEVNKKKKQRQLQKQKRQKYLRAILKQQKVQSIKNYAINQTPNNHEEILQEYTSKFYSQRYHNIDQSYEEDTQRVKIPSFSRLARDFSQQKSRASLFQQNSKYRQIESYIGNPKNKQQQKMSLQSQMKLGSTFYNRQLLDVILKKSEDQQEFKKNKKNRESIYSSANSLNNTEPTQPCHKNNKKPIVAHGRQMLF